MFILFSKVSIYIAVDDASLVYKKRCNNIAVKHFHTLMMTKAKNLKFEFHLVASK